MKCFFSYDDENVDFTFFAFTFWRNYVMLMIDRFISILIAIFQNTSNLRLFLFLQMK